MFAKILHNFFLKLNNDSIELRAVSEKVTKDDLFIKVFLTSMKPVLSFSLLVGFQIIPLFRSLYACHR